MKMINKILDEIESNKKVSILFAVESGSRLWRMESKNSDYDIRFVYSRRIHDYLGLKRFRDVIEHDQNNFDFVGFDIYKFLFLLNKSNPSIIEWLNSDIIYVDKRNFKERLQELINEKFNPKALYYHYRSMCNNNYYFYIDSGKRMTYKKYLYSMRGLVNAKYVKQFNRVPPVIFEEAIDDVKMDTEIKNKLKEVVKIKKQGLESDKVSNIEIFDNYIEDFSDTKIDIEHKDEKIKDDLEEILFDYLIF